MTDVSIFETIKAKPTIIQTVRNEIIVVRSLPAPGPAGPSGTVFLTIDGGGPDTNFANLPLIDGGNP
jgi:hypothetical protein